VAKAIECKSIVPGLKPEAIELKPEAIDYAKVPCSKLKFVAASQNHCNKKFGDL
tara:strand:- start:12 stop:173 length:162 start_codon:yes stop_codon:yes gene_type:complete